jgi:cellulose synthase/poly-beta-1,6-N-acetylglucosamine synthase-like glycosyltransferase
MTVSPISVVVITLNEAVNIRGCLDSLTALDYPQDSYEILVVDASTDETPRIAGEYPKVRLVRSEKGFSQQKKVALKRAAFDILAFTDADCLIPREWLRVIHGAFLEKRIAAIGGNAYPPPGTGRFGMWTACVGHPAGGAIGFDANVERSPNGIAFVPGCNSAFRKEALLDVGGFDPCFFEGGEDVDVSRRLKDKGYYLDYVPELTVFHKPRGTLAGYLRWNIQVGITKFSLRQPSLGRLIFQPAFPLWSLAAVTGIGLLGMNGLPLAALILTGTSSILYLGTLAVLAKPYRLLIMRRRRIGIRLITVLTVVPVLIYLRQVCMNIGQLKKRRRSGAVRTVNNDRTP